ncbi:PHB depolymerase family esterase [Streptomyces sp. YIM 98790]|uniref:extracellular catalytic domain type 1 short-chain-length polyhydroxyalkanoate depolymerase n=1 Tax=Streptomyces sp. YIM 98790 TaxID=2689077 RepID=UPI0028BDC6F4|nr:PHB depolymerase family esterase [Streptomyces sp. YIM 98790]
MTRIRAASAAALSALVIIMAGLGLATPATAASLVEVPDFGSNPGNLRMHVYVPDSRPASPAVLVAMHGCGGSGPGFFQSSEFGSLADRHGFIVIYPTATKSTAMGNCFDVWSDASKRRGGGSDPASIVSMVDHVVRNHGGDAGRVFVTGSSSGGMETNALLALYPDVFRAGAVFMGVPFDCFAGEADFPPWSSRCTGGSMDRTPQSWGDAVRQAHPGYSGPRPRVQLWHGTDDTLVPYQLLREETEQWTNVFGLSQSPTSTDQPQPAWNRQRFADSGGTVRVEAISVQGAGHSLPGSGMAAEAIAFFGLDGSNPGTTGGTTTGGTTTGGTTTGGTTTGGTGDGTCRVRYTPSSWNNGFTADVTVTNTGSGTVNGWTLTWNWAGGQQVTNGWNATVSQSGTQVTARNAAWNAAIAPGAAVSFGFQGTHNGSNPAPTGFTLNGTDCTSG